jgi:hypothetical protein
VPGDELRGQPREWLLDAAADSAVEAAEMDRNDLGDFCIDTDLYGIEHVARLVREQVGI